MNTDEHGLTEKVLGVVYEVSNTLGAGFLEKVYERALLIELSSRGIRAIAPCESAWPNVSIIFALPVVLFAFSLTSKSPRLNGNALFFDPYSSAFICG
jgi:hypothetical protein